MTVTLLDGLTYSALIALLLFIVWNQRRTQTVSKKRIRVRLGLSLILWMVVVLYVVQPSWNHTFNARRVLLYGEAIPADVLQKAQDSLKITDSFSLREWGKRTAENPGIAQQLGTVYLLGQDADPQNISLLSNKEIHWLPSFQKNELQSVHWNALLRKGELQAVTGRIDVDKSKVLRISFANQVLDSVLLPAGLQSFRLRFPAFAIGRTETVLELDAQPLQKVAFYTRKAVPASVYFMLQSPDFESKTLAEWLGKNGSRVEMMTTVAKNTQSNVSLNPSGKQKAFVADVFITDPSNAAHPLVKKAVADGKSVLFFNITDPDQAVKTINSALGTQWRIRKTSNEEAVALGKGVTALPYRFEDNLRQKNVFGYPAAVQKNGGTVGVSLMNETFPLKLSGDSLAYDKIWSSIFPMLSPSQEGTVSAVAPLWKNVRASFVLNKFPQPVPSVLLAQDTVSTQRSALNPLTYTTEYIFRKSGWQSFQDSTEVYVEAEESAAFKAERLREILGVHNQIAKVSPSTAAPQLISSKLPDWAWMLLFLLCLTALWAEAKVQY
jgi:hypothetical protein